MAVWQLGVGRSPAPEHRHPGPAGTRAGAGRQAVGVSVGDWGRQAVCVSVSDWGRQARGVSVGDWGRQARGRVSW